MQLTRYSQHKLPRLYWIIWIQALVVYMLYSANKVVNVISCVTKVLHFTITTYHIECLFTNNSLIIVCIAYTDVICAWILTKQTIWKF